jgi:hypothetical protein
MYDFQQHVTLSQHRQKASHGFIPTVPLLSTSKTIDLVCADVVSSVIVLEGVL